MSSPPESTIENRKSKIRSRIVRLCALHSDEQGTISILTVFTLLMFTMLLMAVFNIAKQHDDKVRMQNAADAAAYSGGVVLARGMNAVAFANHLEADVFALTAFLREARDRNAAGYVPEVLAAWTQAAGKFDNATFPKFQGLDNAIRNKVPLEQEFVTAWSEMAAAASQVMLPVFESILGTPETAGGQQTRDHLIPEFQRTVLSLVPLLAQDMTLEIALRHGLRQQDLESLNVTMLRNPGYQAGVRGPQVGVLWRTSVMPVSYAGESDPNNRTLPIVDPEPYQQDYRSIANGELYLQEARRRREQLAREYLRQWVADMDLTKGLGWADEEASMSQFARLFYSAACGQLTDLLDNQYPGINVPLMLRDFQPWAAVQSDPWQSQYDTMIERDYTFIGVAYRKHVDVNAPRMFRNPLDAAADAQTFATVNLFIPLARYRCCPWGWPNTWVDSTGMTHSDWINNTDNWPLEWSTFNQNWTCQLVPASTSALPQILASNPGGPAESFRPAALNGNLADAVQAVNTH